MLTNLVRGDNPIPAPSTVSPIADAVRCIFPALHEGEAGSEFEPPTSSIDPADVLALTLDIGGSIQLESVITSGLFGRAGADDDTAIPAATRPESALRATIRSRTGEAAQQLRNELMGRFDRLEESLLRRLRAAPEGRSRIHGAETLHAELAARELFGSRSSRALAQIAHNACDAWLLVVAGCLERTRGEARGLRSEFVPRIAELGPEAARITVFDELVTKSTFRFTNQLLGRIPRALGERFRRAVEAALPDLPDTPGADDLAAWYQPGGPVDRAYAEGSSLVRAALQHERQALVGLLDAAAEASGEPRLAAGA